MNNQYGGAQATVEALPQAGGPGFYKKGQANYRKQGSRQCFSTVSASGPASRFLPWLPFMKNMKAG